MRDISFNKNVSGAPASVMNGDYIANTIYQILYTKKNDPYSARGVNIRDIKFKALDDCQAMIPEIKKNIEKYSDIYPVDIQFQIINGVLYMSLSLIYKDAIYKLAVDTTTDKVNVLPI